MSDLLITEADVAAFVAHMNEWAATLSENEQAILAMFATRAMAGAAAEPEVAGFQAAGAPEIAGGSINVDQVLGIGAGGAAFNPFSITRKVDKSSPVLFSKCCTGAHY
jgi:hypothetical protein